MSIDFTVQGTQDSVTNSAIIDTNLKFQNQTSTAVSAIGVVGIDLKQDSAADYFVSPTNQISPLSLKISKFNSIQIGGLYQNAYLDFSADSLQPWFTAVLEISYHDNDIKELK